MMQAGQALDLSEPRAFHGHGFLTVSQSVDCKTPVPRVFLRVQEEGAYARPNVRTAAKPGAHVGCHRTHHHFPGRWPAPPTPPPAGLAMEWA